MLKKKHFLIIIALFSFAQISFAQVSSMKLKVFPKNAEIRPYETAIITTKFFKDTKLGVVGDVTSAVGSKDNIVKTGKWDAKILDKNGGWLSKHYYYQDEDEITDSGIDHLVTQGVGATQPANALLYTAPKKPGKYTIKITVGDVKKKIKITVSDSAKSVQMRETHSFKSPTKIDDKYFPLAEHYAPFIAQETWFTPKADYVSRFDYDRNWKGDDNWENLEKGSSQAFVYYAVVESKTHWFIHYNFFHPRDYSDVCVVGTCHENDNEGLILTVRKNDSKFGELEVLETLAHNNIYSFTNTKNIEKGLHNIDGKIELYKESHPIIFIEAGGHGVYGNSHKSSLFSVKSMDFKKNTGVTYLYKGKAEKPKHPNDRNVGYALLSIYDEWWSRGHKDNDKSNDTFDLFYIYEPIGNRPKASAKYIAGSFKGRTASENKAKPFWAWFDNRAKKNDILSTGQWALDPAYSVTKNLTFPENRPVSPDYIYNPFLDLSVEK